MPDQVDLDHLDALYAACDPGTWEVWQCSDGLHEIRLGKEVRFEHMHIPALAGPDCELTAALHNAYPALRERIRELEARVSTFAGWSVYDIDKLFLVLDLAGHPERLERVQAERRELMAGRDRIRDLEARVANATEAAEIMAEGGFDHPADRARWAARFLGRHEPEE